MIKRVCLFTLLVLTNYYGVLCAPIDTVFIKKIYGAWTVKKFILSANASLTDEQINIIASTAFEFSKDSAMVSDRKCNSTKYRTETKKTAEYLRLFYKIRPELLGIKSMNIGVIHILCGADTLDPQVDSKCDIILDKDKVIIPLEGVFFFLQRDIKIQ